MKFREMNLPNKLTFIRMLCVPLVIVLFLLNACSVYFGWGFLSKHLIGDMNFLHIIIFVLFVCASVTDYIDGYLARKNNIVSDYGKMMDPLADKLLVNSTLICLAAFGFFYCPYIKNVDVELIVQVALSAVVIAVIFRDFFVDSLRMQSVKNGIVVPASILGKMKTATLMPGIAIMIISPAAPFLFYIAATLLFLGGVFAVIGGVQYYRSIMPSIEK